MAKLLTGIAAALFLVTPALAEAPTGSTQPNFATVNQRRLAQIIQRRACVAKAANLDEMKACTPPSPQPWSAVMGAWQVSRSAPTAGADRMVERPPFPSSPCSSMTVLASASR